MDERELVGLLYRADWSRLTLTGSLRGASGSLLSMFGGSKRQPLFGRQPPPEAHPPFLTPDLVDGEIGLRVAPGLRFRVDAADGRWAGGCDGSRVWQWRAAVPADARARFNDRPRPPAESLLAPSWLLSGHTLVIEGTATVGGREGVLVSAVPAGSHGLNRHAARRWRREGRYERASVVVDAALGILLRCAVFSVAEEAKVTEFTALTAGAQADPALLAPPLGSVFGGGPVPDDGSEIDDLLARVLGEAGLAAAKTAGGVAAGGLGALIRYAPARRDPLAHIRAVDPDAAMPAEELPGWARSGISASAGAVPPDLAGPPVDDALLHLLYRSQVEPVPFTAAVHQWHDLALLLAAAPARARRDGFDGVGFLINAARERTNALADPVAHKAWALRFGRWDKYRIDVLTPLPGARANGAVHARLTPVTIACDGSRLRQVYANRVEVFDVRELDESFGDLVDGSWLLDCRLSGGEEAIADGRRGYLVIATARPGAAPLELSDWAAGSWLPAAAVVDAATGRLLRLTGYVDGRPARRVEFRSLSDGGSDDFGFTPAAGLRIEDHSMATFLDTHGDPDSVGPDGVGFTPINPGGEVADAVGAAVRERAADAVTAARGFFGSVLRDRGRRR